MIGHPLEQIQELGGLCWTEAGQKILFLFVGELFGLAHQVLRLSGEVYGVCTPIVWVHATPDETSCLEAVHQPHHHVAMHSDGVGELLL